MKNFTDYELEEIAFFWIFVAGKSARTIRPATREFCKLIDAGHGPFHAVREAFSEGYPLAELIRSCGIGCYNLKAAGIIEISRAGLDLRTCSPDDLERIPGIGPKTARCFILDTRPGARYAGLDTHVLKHLRSLGYDAPKSTPGSKKKYLELEKIMLDLADAAGKTPGEYDLEVWQKYSLEKNLSETMNGFELEK